MDFILGILKFLLITIQSILGLFILAGFGSATESTTGMTGLIGIIIILIIICVIVSNLRKYEHITLMIIVEFILSPTAIFRYIIGGIFSLIFGWDFSLEMLGDGLGYALNFLFYAYPDNKISSSTSRYIGNDNEEDYKFNTSNKLPDGYSNGLDCEMRDISNSYSGSIDSAYGISASIDEYVSQNRITFNISVTYEISDLDGLNRSERAILGFAQSAAKELARKVKQSALDKIENLNCEYGVNKSYNIVVNINVSKY